MQIAFQIAVVLVAALIIACLMTYLVTHLEFGRPIFRKDRVRKRLRNLELHAFTLYMGLALAIIMIGYIFTDTVFRSMTVPVTKGETWNIEWHKSDESYSIVDGQFTITDSGFYIDLSTGELAMDSITDLWDVGITGTYQCGDEKGVFTFSYSRDGSLGSGYILPYGAKKAIELKTFANLNDIRSNQKNGSKMELREIEYTNISIYAHE